MTARWIRDVDRCLIILTGNLYAARRMPPPGRPGYMLRGAFVTAEIIDRGLPGGAKVECRSLSGRYAAR